jgi:hypothetical protein
VWAAAGCLTNRLADQCPLEDLSPAVVHGCRGDFMEAWTSLGIALSDGLHITDSVDDEENAMTAVGLYTHKERHGSNRQAARH